MSEQQRVTQWGDVPAGRDRLCRCARLAVAVGALSVLSATGQIPTAVAAERMRLPRRLVVDSGVHARRDAAVSWRADGSGDRGAVALFELRGGEEIPTPVQTGPEKPARFWWVLSGETPAHARRTYELRESRGAPAELPARSLSIRQDRAAVEFRSGDVCLLRYNHAFVAPPEGIDPRNGRSGHIHPVRTPAGRMVTDEFPPDHPHQSGLFQAFVRTEFEGRQPDFWNLPGGTGRVESHAVAGLEGGPVYASLCGERRHVDLTQPKPVVVLREDWEVRLWIPAAGQSYAVMDLRSTLRCAGEQPLKLPQFHYGGMALRGAREWTPENCRVLTAEGHGREEGNHTRTWWCDLTGKVGGESAGLALMTHPDNFRAPEPLRIHPTMPYMVYTPSHLGDWGIRPGEPHIARYRFVAHDGELPVETLERLWREFAEPPQVRAE